MFNFITNLLNINENEIEDLKVLSLPSETQFHITLFPTFPSCPYCGGTVQGHGHTKPKRINRPVLTDKKTSVFFRNNRYLCNDCGRTFSSKNPFTFSTFKNSIFLLDRVMKQLKNLNYTYLMIARSNHISVTQVQLYFDSFINIPKITLPVSLGINEIHSRMAKRKDASYLAVLVDNLNRSLVDILPST